MVSPDRQRDALSRRSSHYHRHEVFHRRILAAAAAPFLLDVRCTLIHGIFAPLGKNGLQGGPTLVSRQIKDSTLVHQHCCRRVGIVAQPDAHGLVGTNDKEQKNAHNENGGHYGKGLIVVVVLHLSQKTMLAVGLVFRSPDVRQRAEP